MQLEVFFAPGFSSGGQEMRLPLIERAAVAGDWDAVLYTNINTGGCPLSIESEADADVLVVPANDGCVAMAAPIIVDPRIIAGAAGAAR